MSKFKIKCSHYSIHIEKIGAYHKHGQTFATEPFKDTPAIESWIKTDGHAFLIKTLSPYLISPSLVARTTHGNEEGLEWVEKNYHGI